ncbi:MAG TPA: undecaprenyldiphospho-muramoylpentapeptide beta-N-acetylglucosaminyltransferase [Vicinamibacterales bacterium]|nr:undecaprenyldiphospho-muramoylpentapeptide beta-N-acetylglucosaminyltransferase [Vicinamibacterales bacterium]
MALTVVIAGGGTGGHLYPGIAVAREILRRDPKASVSFAGTARGLETRIVPKEGFELDLIRAAGLKGKSMASRLRGALLVPAGLVDAWRLLTRRRPDIVIGVGGYSSGPVVMTAALRRIPTLVLEQNAVPGLTNRLLAPWVRAAAVNFSQTLSYFGRRGFVAGNPVREEFFQSSEFEARSPTSSNRRVLILGGSQGAHAINVAMVAAAARLVASIPGLEVVHQTGERDLAAVRQGYERGGVSARAEPFFDAVAREMNAADLVICRAGATTLAELAASGTPAVLIPFPAATDDHQKKNAQVLANAGAAVLIEEKSLSPETLSGEALAILSQDARRQAMGAAMKNFARLDAAARITDRVFGLTGRTEGAAS